MVKVGYRRKLAEKAYLKKQGKRKNKLKELKRLEQAGIATWKDVLRLMPR